MADFVQEHNVSKHLTRELKKGGASVLYYCKNRQMYDCKYKVDLRYPAEGDEIRAHTDGQHDHTQHKSNHYFSAELKAKIEHGVKARMPPLKIRQVRNAFCKL